MNSLGGDDIGSSRKAVPASAKGFTLAEMMIVVVIIGLLAALAMPAYTKVAQVTHRNMMLADAKQIGAAVEQYFTEESVRTVSLSIDPVTGNVDLPLGKWVPRVTKGSSITTPIEQDGTFEMMHPKVRGGDQGAGALGAPVQFTSFGQIVTSP